MKVLMILFFAVIIILGFCLIGFWCFPGIFIFMWVYNYLVLGFFLLLSTHPIEVIGALIFLVVIQYIICVAFRLFDRLSIRKGLAGLLGIIALIIIFFGGLYLLGEYGAMLPTIMTYFIIVAPFLLVGSLIHHPLETIAGIIIFIITVRILDAFSKWFMWHWDKWDI